jgi:hypothetical protein
MDIHFAERVKGAAGRFVPEMAVSQRLYPPRNGEGSVGGISAVVLSRRFGPFGRFSLLVAACASGLRHE